MNERIKELADQALAKVNALNLPLTCSEEIIQHGKVYNEKFAELIVRESIVDFYRNCLDTTSNEDITVQVDRYVKEHFGVE